MNIYENWLEYCIKHYTTTTIAIGEMVFIIAFIQIVNMAFLGALQVFQITNTQIPLITGYLISGIALFKSISVSIGLLINELDRQNIRFGR